MAGTQLLYIEDDPEQRQSLAESLRERGFEVDTAGTGAEGLELLDGERHELILCDLNMPGMDGYETCRRLKADAELEKSVVVFLSARGDLDDKLEGFDSGAVDYISKPFQFEEVVARVKKHLESFHRERGLETRKQELEAKLGERFREMDEALVRDLIAGG